jgi:hypothetical protein
MTGKIQDNRHTIEPLLDHRTVIQKRMKLSGQHRSGTSSKNMLRLRVISMNKQWHKVIEHIKNPHPVAA